MEPFVPTDTTFFCWLPIHVGRFGYYKLYPVQRLLLFALQIEVFGCYEIMNLGVTQLQVDIELCINFIDWISRYISKR